MTFEEWTIERGTYGMLGWENDYAEEAWNAALDEAVKVVEDYGMPPFDDVIKKAIKELKE